MGNSTSGDGLNGNSTSPDKSGVYGSNSANGGFGVFGRNTFDGSTGYLGAVGVGVGGSSLSITGDATIAGGASVRGGLTAGNMRSNNGWVNYNGTVLLGTGFSSVENHPGNYTVSFPAGSFTAFPVISVQPAQAVPVNINVSSYTDGSASFTVDFEGNNVPFAFLANQVNPGNLPSAPTLGTPVAPASQQAGNAGAMLLANSSLPPGGPTTLQSAECSQASQIQQLTKQVQNLQERLARLEAKANNR